MPDWLKNFLGGSGLPGFLGVIGNLISSIWSNSTNTQNVNNNNALQIGLAGAANQWSIDQWNRENAYNTPEMQRQRMLAGGFNPALLMSNGVQSLAGSSPSVQMPITRAAQVTAPQVDPLTASQIRLNDASARKIDSENEYQQYMNAVEKALAHLPIGEVRVETDNGEQEVHVEYGNARVIMTEREMKALGLSLNGLQYQLSDLFFDLAVKCGNLDFTAGHGLFNPLETTGGREESAALRGDRTVRDIAGKLAIIGEEAATAEKAGRVEYAKWLEENKNDPFVKFALTVQGFLQSSGISLPNIGMQTGVSPKGTKTYQWFFGR